MVTKKMSSCGTKKMATGGAVAKKPAAKKYNTGGSVDYLDKGIKARTIMSDALRRREEESGLKEAVLTKAKTTKPAETPQYVGKKLAISEERRKQQEANKRKLLNKPLD